MSDHDADAEAILRLHRDWYYANFEINIPLMRTVFPVGEENFLMFNLNDHPYFGVDDLADLWSFYAQTDRWGLCEDDVMRVEVVGDMAYVVSEGIYPSWIVKDDDGEPLDNEIPVIFNYRSTEVYKRDDGDGRAEWRMWHFHCSTRPPDDQAPPAKTLQHAAVVRGLGNTPHRTAIRTDYSAFLQQD